MDDRLLWYTTRGAGAVSLVLLSIVTALGLLGRARVASPWWPRFMTTALHRDIALLSVTFLGLHIITAIVDPFTHLGLAALVPFASGYRTLWLGLGAVAVLLLVALIVSSLARQVIGLRAWRVIHWCAYGCWPIAVMHGLGTGTDSWAGWMLAITILCVGLVAIALLWRVTATPEPLAVERRTMRASGALGGER